MKCYFGFLCLVCLSLFTVNSQGQDFEDFVKKYTGSNGQLYMQPLADAFGANLNSGLYHNAYIREKGFQVYLGVAYMHAPIPERRRTFTGSTQGYFYPTQQVKAPTIFGKSELVAVDGDGGTEYVFPGGLDLNNLPLAVPNLTIGSLYGTNATFRWAAYDIGDQVGKVELLGWGLRHSIDQYIPTLPLNMAIGFYTQRFTLGDIVDAGSWLANIQASYQWEFITFYGGLGYENSTLDIQYTYEEDDSEIAFDLTGNNTLRGTLGLTLNLGPLKIHSGYTLASQSLLTLGLGLGFNEIEKPGE
jgi:hypothetical protein